jgi:hypothetical protein
LICILFKSQLNALLLLIPNFSIRCPPPNKKKKASTFDFSDFGVLGGESDMRNEIEPMGAKSGEDLPIFQSRDRAFSFEVFNFSGDDDLLPVQVASSSPLHTPTLAPVNEDTPKTRPRGDSIIFDPSSFQDGGIHEKNALEKARQKELAELAPLNSMPAPAPVPSTVIRFRPLPQAEHHCTVQQQAPQAVPRLVQGPAKPMPQTVTSRANGSAVLAPNMGGKDPDDSVEMATLPSALSDGTDTTQSPATFQLDLLNKDGRIGIYLPDARRARIARFHAKRKMRIWRKRIKYDCRKKLADSRPRIKGRFVKRSDMDDDN